MSEFNQASNCLRFMESMRLKMETLMRTGDITDHRTVRRSSDEIDAICREGIIMVQDGMTVTEAAERIGVQRSTLERRLKNEK